MAQIQPPNTGQKRGPGRPPKTAVPAAKRLKTSATQSSTLASPATQSPTVASPGPDRKAQGARLPSKIHDNKPLPTLSTPQSLSLAADDYQTIAASAVLQASLVRSRLKWVSEGIFPRYWVKPESGKSAKPVPANNPDIKWMKDKGECRIRLEPHLFTAHVFVEERPRPKAVVQNQNGYGQQFRPQFGQQATSSQPSTQQMPPPRALASPALPQTQDKKASPDPVISMLASRASSDPELKALMKEVATGNANQDQLKIFQRHIDELTGIIQKHKKDEGQAALRQAQVRAMQHDQIASTKPNLPLSSMQPQQSKPIYSIPQSPTAVYQAPTPWTPPTNLPVVIQFLGLGATEDRFLFPQHSILEKLSPQHELASFIITRKGRDAIDPIGLEPDKEYWVPVTMMVEVMYGREEILHFIRRWVKPADEVRKHMSDVMQRFQRAPETYLAVRLPFRGVTMTEGEPSKEPAPANSECLEKPKPRSKTSAKEPKVAKTASDSMTSSEVVLDAKGSESTSAAAGTVVPDLSASSVPEKDIDANKPAASGDAETPNSAEGGRPRRTVRKSVRISEV